MKKDINEIIQYPILTEKTNLQMSKGVYTFAINVNANRTEVKNTVEFIFNVKVKKVNILNKDKQVAKLGSSTGWTNKIKKAIVTLKEGKINIYPDDQATTSKEKSKEKPAKKKMSLAEKRAAKKIAEKKAAQKKPEKEKKSNFLKFKFKQKKI